jgi:serine/threonine protein kinase/Tfp pilus assembly protein PilF
MDRRDPCPDPALLTAFVEGTLADDAAIQLAQHLDGCDGCRERLERLPAASDLLAAWRPGVAADSSERSPALQRVLFRLKAGSPLDRPAGDTEPAAEPPTAADTVGFEATPSGSTGAHPALPASAATRRIGPYQLLERVGEGGMGVVYKAIDPPLNRVVAVKVLSPALASSPLGRRRFIREAQAAAAVCHEHVVTIHAVDDAEDQPYLVMQYVPGISLQDKIDRVGPLGLKEVLRIGMQIASGLAAAHAQGLVHRDIKPSNVLLENGVERAKITDFGLARASTDAGLTQAGTLVGTPQFMAPEQARGERPDLRSDLFSLGSVLYAMTTGEAPFQAENTVAVLRKVSDEAPRAIREINPEAPGWLVRIIDRLMSKDPDARYHTAAEVAALLADRLAALQGPGRLDSLPGEPAAAPPRRGVGRRVGATLVVGALSLAALLTLAFALIPGRRRSEKSAELGRSDLVAESSPAASTAASAPVPATSGFAPNWLNLGLAANRQKNHNEAVKFLTEAIRLDSRSVGAHVARGDAYRYLGNNIEALADYNEAIRLNAKNANAYYSRAFVLTQLSEHDRAIADCDQALLLDPDLVWTYFHRAMAYERRCDWPRAIGDYSTFLGHVPDFSPAYLGRAAAHAGRGDAAQALADSKKAVDLKPNDPPTLTFRAWIRARMGEYDGAIADYSTVLQADPHDAVNLSARACAFALAGRFDEAHADFEASLRETTKYPWPLVRRAYNLYARRGDFDRAISDCDAMLQVDPNFAEAYFYRGLAFLEKREDAHAVADLDHVLALDQPERMTFQGPLRARYPEIYEARATAHERLGDRARAKADRNQAQRLRTQSDVKAAAADAPK